MKLLQTLRRIGQLFSNDFVGQEHQQSILKRLYARNGLDIVLTCPACPEQYEVFRDGKQVAYYRLRHGSFSVSVPDVGGKDIIDASPNGDGVFNDSERLIYLTKAMRAVIKEIENPKP